MFFEHFIYPFKYKFLSSDLYDSVHYMEKSMYVDSKKPKLML